MLRLLVIGVLTCTMGARGTYHSYMFALKNHFHIIIIISIKLSCFVILLKLKEFTCKTIVEKRWGTKSNQSCILICNLISKVFVVD